MRETQAIPIDERCEKILEDIDPLEPLDVTLTEARGCLVADDVVATKPWPHYSSCSTAGFAAKWADCTEGSLLSVVGKTSAKAVKASADDSDEDVVTADSDAGKPRKSRKTLKLRRTKKPRRTDAGKADTVDVDVVDAIGDGEAVELHVGAPLPAGADVVIPFDAVKIDEDSLVVKRAVEPGQGVSVEGSIAAEGTLLIPGRTLIDPRRVGILAAVGLSRVTVIPRPRVVIVSVGNDLVSDNAETDSTHKHDATSSLLASAAAAAGAVPYRVAPVADVPEIVAETLDDQLIRADVIVVCGAVASPSDTIREVLKRIGDVSYDGGTTNLGVFGTGFLGDEGTHLVSLPRDPVSAYLLFRVLVDPVIAGMLGLRLPEFGSINLDVDVPLSSDRTQFALASVDDEGRATPMTGESPTLVDLQRADAVMRILPGSGTEQSGSSVAALMFSGGSDPT